MATLEEPITSSRLERNGFFCCCWGVKFGLAEGNRIDGSRNYGISVGHNDTDNVMRKNDVTNSGGEDGVSIDIQDKTKDVRIVGNILRETRKPMNRDGIRIDGQAGNVELTRNTTDGFAADIRDNRWRT